MISLLKNRLYSGILTKYKPVGRFQGHMIITGHSVIAHCYKHIYSRAKSISLVCQ